MKSRKPRATPSFRKCGAGTRSGSSGKTMDLKRLETLGLIEKIDPNHIEYLVFIWKWLLEGG